MSENIDTPSSSQQQVHVETARPSARLPASRLRRAGVALAAGLFYLLLIDAAVETFLAGAPVRRIVGATVAAYLALSVLLRRKLTVGGSASASLFVLLGLLAFSAWRPEGLTAGIAMLRQPTSTVLTTVTALAILLAAWVLARVKFLPVALRVVIGLLALYGLAGMVWGIVTATPYPALFHGLSLWMRLPFWLQGAFIGGLVLLPVGVVLQAVAAAVGTQGRQRRTDALLAAVSGLSLAVVAAAFVAPVGIAGALGPADQIGHNGPGLRRPATESFQLPVPRTFDLLHVEPAHFAAALGNDPSRIFQYVRDQIAYEAYPGCLRGPRGTLMAMAGNSVDRAALLGSLLERAGQRVRYARGRLPEALAQQLVASMWAERAQAAPANPDGEPSPELKAAGERLVSAIKRDGALLRDSLRKAGYPTSREAAVTSEALVTEARDHYWIEWWQNGAWVDLDPSFATATPGQVYAKAEETFDVLPESLFHRVGIRIRLEEYAGDKPSTREILQYTAKAADLSGVDLVLAHQAEKAKRQGSGYLAPFASASEGTRQVEQVKPLLLVQRQQVTGLPFRLKAPSEGTSGPTDELLGGAGTTESVPVATAESIEFDFIAPGGRRETVVREIFDLVGKARRLKGQALGAEEVATRSEASNPDDFTGALYDLLITTGSIDAAHLRDLTNPPPAGGEPIDVRAGLRRVNTAFVAVSDALLSRIANARGAVCRCYVDSPRVQIAELSTKARVFRLGLDLRRDRARAVVTGFRREPLFYAQVLRGVVDGTLERIVMDYFAGSSREKESRWAPGISTSLLFERAQAANTPAVLLARDSTALRSDVPEDTRARIDETLAAGQLVLAPQGPVAVGGAPRFAWWQIDPRSGMTTAVTDEGLHQDVLEIRVLHDKDTGETTVLYGLKGDVEFGVSNFRTLGEGSRFANALGHAFIKDMQQVLISFLEI